MHTVKFAFSAYTVLLALTNLYSHITTIVIMIKKFYCSKIFPSAVLSTSLLLSYLATTDVFCGHIILPLQECHFNEIIQYVGFLLWLLLFSIIHWRFTYNVASIRCSFLLSSSIPLCRNTKIRFIHSPVERYLFFFYKCDLQISSHFSFSWHCLLKNKCFWFWWNLIYQVFSLMDHALAVVSKKSSFTSTQNFSLFFLLEVI